MTIEEDNGSWTLKPSVNSQVALPAIVKGAGATITADDMTVTFENTGNDVMVHTSGSGNIPEVSQAVASLEEALFGNDGIAWKGGEGAVIEIAESDRPETLSFNDAIAAGIITTIGEYTTEFSNQEARRTAITTSSSQPTCSITTSSPPTGARGISTSGRVPPTKLLVSGLLAPS